MKKCIVEPNMRFKNWEEIAQHPIWIYMEEEQKSIFEKMKDIIVKTEIEELIPNTTYIPNLIKENPLVLIEQLLTEIGMGK